MKRLVPLAGLVLSLGVVPPAPAANGDVIPMRDFFRNPDRAYYRISGDGKTLSFMQPWERRMNIYVQPIGSNAEPVRITSEKDRDIPNYFWKGADRVVYTKDFGGDENNHIVVVDRRGGEPLDVTPFPGVKAIIVDPLVEIPGRMLIGLNKRVKEVFDVYDLDLASGKLALVAENPGNITSWGADHDGNVRFAIATDGVDQTYLYRDDAKAPFKPVLKTTFRDQFQPLVFTADNKKLYVASNLRRDKVAIVLVDPASAKEAQVVYGRDDVDVQNVAWSRARQRVSFVNYQTWKDERHYLDPDAKDLFSKLEAKLPGYQVTLQSLTDDETRMIVAATNDRTQGTRYLYDRNADSLTKLGDVTPWLPEAKMAAVKPIEYKTRDGLTVNGYLTLPNGVAARKLPVVVNPHGGPWARDGWGFNPEVQFLANRGYAVLQMNYRGSTGYGRKFWEASFKQWGFAMQDDITDGVHWLIEQGIADPKRICIYGGSYGGYATLEGLVKTPDLYACGVDYVGVANLFTFMKTIPPYWKPFLAMMHQMVGDPEKDKERLAAASPALNADRIKAPLLIAQGARDPRVNKDESDQMVAALSKRGIDVPYLVKDNEGHGFHNEENQFDFYEAMEKFLAKYLGSRAQL
ncbi:MAG TPA: S9 family peptidase [Casimicrobiaceae bacterium]|jgi:dipeptidyl aminopeptidase/acylaminoacyl peptidase|nr:S9 family peptidase [Casimicrobiaceae bacterium]